MGVNYEDVQLYAEHVEDPGAPADHLRPDTVEKGAGHIEVGVVIDGVRKPLQRFKAGGFLDDHKRSQDQKQQGTQESADTQQSY